MNVKRAQIVERTQKASAEHQIRRTKSAAQRCIKSQAQFSNNCWLSFKLHFTSHQTFNNIMKPLTIISRIRHLVLREPRTFITCSIALFVCSVCMLNSSSVVSYQRLTVMIVLSARHGDVGIVQE